MDLDAMPWCEEESPAPEDVDDGDRWREVLYHITILIACDVNPFMHFICCVVVVINRVISHIKYQVVVFIHG